MIVKISDYGSDGDKKFIDYDVYGLSSAQMKFLDNELSEKTCIEENMLKIKMYFTQDLYPFQSDVAQIRLDDFIAREEIEMNVFLSSFLEDMSS